MGSWRDVAAAAREVPSSPASDREDIAAVARQLASLARMPPPRRINDPAAWTAVIEDGQRLIDDGWASSAISLGWTMLDLFGVGSNDSWEYSGLAVWLDGRRIIALDERRAIAANDVGRDRFNRGGWGHGKDAGVVPVLLWEFGR